MPYIRKHPHGKPMSMAVAAATLRALLAPRRVKCVILGDVRAVFLDSAAVAAYSSHDWESIISLVLTERVRLAD